MELSLSKLKAQKQPTEVFYKKKDSKKTLLKKRLQHSCFPVNIQKILRTPILKNICKQLLRVVSNLQLW